MAKGKKTGGRVKGSKNRATVDVEAKFKRLGYDPIAGMASIAMDQTAPLELRARMHSECSQYIAPKRKAMEVTGKDGSELTVRILKHAHD